MRYTSIYLSLISNLRLCGRIQVEDQRIALLYNEDGIEKLSLPPLPGLELPKERVLGTLGLACVIFFEVTTRPQSPQ